MHDRQTRDHAPKCAAQWRLICREHVAVLVRGPDDLFQARERCERFAVVAFAALPLLCKRNGLARTCLVFRCCLLFGVVERDHAALGDHRLDFGGTEHIAKLVEGIVHLVLNERLGERVID